MSRHEVFSGPAQPVEFEALPGVKGAAAGSTSVSGPIADHRAAVGELHAVCAQESSLAEGRFKRLEAKAHRKIDIAYRRLLRAPVVDLEALAELTAYFAEMSGEMPVRKDGLVLDGREQGAALMTIAQAVQRLIPVKPTEPISKALLNAYDEWLDLERSWLKWERFGMAGMEMLDRATVEVVYRNRQTGKIFDYRPCNRVIADHGGQGDSPSLRAAKILAAAGASIGNL